MKNNPIIDLRIFNFIFTFMRKKKFTKINK